jgi:hypothetical protein
LRFDTQDNLGYQGVRLDTEGGLNRPIYEGNNAELELREWYVDTEMAGVFWRLGKQQVVWGQADGLKVLDVINPQSYREFILDDFDDSRLPLWMINAEIPIGDEDSLQFLLIMDPSYHRFANNGSDYLITSPLLVPQPLVGITMSVFEEHKPNNVIKDSDIGLRYSKFYQGWDLTFNYLYHYLDNPVFYQTLKGDSLTIDAEYQRNHLFGISASKALGDWTIRSELGYSTQSYHLLAVNSQVFLANKGIGGSKDLSSVIGVDWQGLSDTMLSIQWFQSTLLDDLSEREIGLDTESAMYRSKQNQMWSFLLKKSFANETWQFEALTLYGAEKHDSSIQMELSYMVESNVKIWLGADLFAGNKQSLLGQFRDTDRLLMGVEWGF